MEVATFHDEHCHLLADVEGERVEWQPPSRGLVAQHVGHLITYPLRVEERLALFRLGIDPIDDRVVRSTFRVPEGIAIFEPVELDLTTADQPVELELTEEELLALRLAELAGKGGLGHLV